jgi:hypothetical protein
LSSKEAKNDARCRCQTVFVEGKLGTRRTTLSKVKGDLQEVQDEKDKDNWKRKKMESDDR